MMPGLHQSLMNCSWSFVRYARAYLNHVWTGLERACLRIGWSFRKLLTYAVPQPPTQVPAGASNNKLQDIEVGRLLGSGSFGNVYAASRVSTGKKLVIKMVEQGKIIDTNDLVMEKEAFVRARGCKQLLQLEEDDILGNGDVYQIFDRWSMDLRTFCKSAPFSTEVLKFIAFELFLGIEHLHRNGVGHRDIKPDNIFVNVSKENRQIMSLCLGDFGMPMVTPTAVGLYGTIAYGAPEISATVPYDCRIDWFAFGVSLYSIVTGMEPFNFNRQHCPRYTGLALTGKLSWPLPYQGPEALPEYFEDFVNGLMEVDVNKRLDAPGIRAHPFLQNIPLHWVDNQTLTGQTPVSQAREILLDDSFATLAVTGFPKPSPPVSHGFASTFKE
ncbi:Serine/threonine kinase [Phlyctochytrium planicorne]|nr:Serine/threonine kinase [Phlyctochytrium planicorne]